MYPSINPNGNFNSGGGGGGGKSASSYESSGYGNGPVASSMLTPPADQNSCFSASALATLGPELDPIYARLESLRGHTLRLEELQLAYLADNERRTQRKIEAAMNAINKDALEVKALMGRFEQSTQHMAAEGRVQANIIEMRKNQHSNLGKKLVEYTKNAWTMQRDHEKKRTKQAATRLKMRFAGTTAPDGSVGMADDEAERIAAQLVQTGNDDQLFVLARDELERAMATKDQVLEIERAMRELYQMFCDLNVLVVEQGESMNEVERLVKSTTKNVVKGNKELKKAKKHQRACAIM